MVTNEPVSQKRGMEGRLTRAWPPSRVPSSTQPRLGDSLGVNEFDERCEDDLGLCLELGGELIEQEEDSTGTAEGEAESGVFGDPTSWSHTNHAFRAVRVIVRSSSELSPPLPIPHPHLPLCWSSPVSLSPRRCFSLDQGLGQDQVRCQVRHLHPHS